MLMETAVTHNWSYLDLWNAVPAEEFTDTPVHLTPDGTKLLAEMVAAKILKIKD
jgi:lysophospholipase L1-like esterase